MTATPKSATRTLPSVVCLHASGGSGAQWRVLADALRPAFRVLTPDLHGHGDAPAWSGARRDVVAADAARIAAIAASAGGDVYLVGHSYGGAIALRVARDHPSLVAGVAVYEPVVLRALFDYNPHHRSAAEVAEIARAIRRDLNGGDRMRAAHRFLRYWSGEGAWAGLADERRLRLAGRMPVIDAHFASLIGDAVALGDYRDVVAPVLCMTGRQTRASARRIVELLRFVLPHAEAVTFDAMGHLGPITHAETIARCIAGFIRRSAACAAYERRAA
jgi:pimeloyl-ACP methyl ester carboxylesterase